MSGGPPEVTSPPEVPDEFAAAYREAYERALLDQTDAPRHRRPAQYRPGYVEPTTAPVPVETASPGRPVSTVEPVETPAVATLPVETPATRSTADVDLPERRGRLMVGTHRQEAALDVGDTWFDHVRDSRLFVPVLLAALALLLVLGAYVLGRAFTAAVGG